MTFAECCVFCAGERELVEQFNRLKGLHMGESRDGFTRMIDESCGYHPDIEAFPEFISFVHDFIWTPLLNQENKSV